MKQSTRDIVRMHGWRIDRAIHNYLYFSQYDRYVRLFLDGGRKVKERLGRLPVARHAFALVFNRYHAKVLSGEDVTKILTLEQSVDFGPDTTERVIPFRYANQIILQEPDYIAVMDCPCRLSRENPCLPINVCVAVGKTTARFWLEHGRRLHARRISQEEALELIRGERQKGRITTIWLKVATGGRTGVICSCCSCCCGGLEGMRLARQVRGGEELTNIIASGYLVQWESDRCDHCGKCAEVCMFDAITLDENGVPEYEPDKCFGCGLCVEHCEQGGRTLAHGRGDLDPLDLDLAREKLG